MPDGLRTAAFRLLGRRDLTRAELVERLVDRGYGLAETQAAVDRLVDEGAVNDLRTARAHVRTASRIKGRGRLRIQRELAARHIAREIIEQALDQLEPGDDLEGIRKFLARRRVPDELSQAERRRVFQQLLRRGFSADAIAKALKFREDEDGNS